MPYWIEGWLEVRRGGRGSDAAWLAVLQLGPLIDVADAVSERLFGLSKRLTAAGAPPDIIAANRGVPADASEEVRTEVASHAPYPSEVGGYTHAGWNELTQHGLDAAVVAESDWQIVFDFAQRLANDERFGPDGVRIVVWYNW